MLSKEHIITALHAWIAQRPGLDYANYGEPKSYNAEVRSITKDLREARTLLRAVELRDSITADDLLQAFPRAYSGRLSISETTNKKGEKAARLDYCTGQYWPTEYRRAACAVLASVLWTHVREHCMPEAEYEQHGTAEDHPMQTVALYDGLSAGDYIRRHFKREFGLGIQRRWFD